MEYTEYYKCNECGNKFSHNWDTSDYNDDYTQCPKGCDDFDFDEIDFNEFNKKTHNLGKTSKLAQSRYCGC